MNEQTPAATEPDPPTIDDKVAETKFARPEPINPQVEVIEF